MRIQLQSTTNEKTGKTHHSCPTCPNKTERSECYRTFPGGVDIGSCECFIVKKTMEDPTLGPYCNWYVKNKVTLECPGGCGNNLQCGQSLCSECEGLEMAKEIG